MKKFFIFLAAAVMLTGCTAGPRRDADLTPETVSIETVADKEYVLTNQFVGENLTLGFDKEGRIFGFAGINRFFGKATIVNGTITIDALGTTRMAGPREKMIIEDQYLTLLKSAKTISIEKDALILTNEREESLIFNRK